MEIHQLDAKTIHSAFINACDYVVANREHINSINLFPVADGDTGDNMSATALSVIHYSAVKPTLKETLQSLANSALLGARGNSGMIFSQFFNGLTEQQLISEQIDTKRFAELITNAGQSVRSAIMHPVEGTIITVIDAWSESARKLAIQYPCFKKLIKNNLIEVYQALQSTSSTLPVLKNAHVVDAGALGFYHFISGFADYLANPREIDTSKLHHECVDTHHDLPVEGEQPEQRYCTEIMLSGANINRKQISTQLEQYGDSVVSSGNTELCRFHVHCKKPTAVFESLLNTGHISQAKAQDMLRQYQMIHQRKHSIALVTDSSADLPQDILDEHQIHIIPLNMHLDGHNLLDRLCISQESFYDRLSSLKTYPKTSFPSPALIEEHMHQVAAHYDHVLILPIAQSLSGTHAAIVKATEKLSNIHIMDTCQTSAGLGLIVKFAAELIEKGLSIEDIKHEIALKLPKMHVYIYVYQFESLIRSGRVNKLSGKIAQFANIKPIITLNKVGKGVMFDKAFSEQKALTKIVGYISDLMKKEELDSYAIVHAGVPEKGLEFSHLTTETFGKAPAFIEPASTALGLHAGKGCIGLCTMMK